MPSYFLGLDSSTQSLSAILIDHEQRCVVAEHGLNFSKDLPQWQTTDGVLRNADPTVVHAPPLMWAEALDQLFTQLKEQGWPLGEVIAIAGSGQQHGSVYLNNQVDSTLPMLDPDRPLHEQLHCCLARETAPIWMDSSTGSQCAAIAAAVGGNDEVLRRTGSVATERFTAAQILKFDQEDEQGWAATTHVCLVSSFMASLLAGEVVGIDHGDASGMNLLDIRHRCWDRDLVRAAGIDLDAKLQDAVPSHQVVGTVAPYMVMKFGLAAECKVVAFTGDNPSSLVGLGLVEDGMCAISLGTSDTAFAHYAACPETFIPEGHIFCAPTGGWMSLLCFKNGSLARERIRSDYGIADWATFGELVASTPPGNNGGLMLPWFDPEIVPKVLTPGIARKGLDPDDSAANCRAVYEGQMLAMRLHLQQAGMRPTSLRATGGASRDRALIRIMADVFQAPVSLLETPNSAGLGAALRAVHAINPDTPWAAIVADYTAAQPGSTVTPDPSLAAVYDALLDDYAAFEQAVIDTRC